MCRVSISLTLAHHHRSPGNSYRLPRTPTLTESEASSPAQNNMSLTHSSIQRIYGMSGSSDDQSFVPTVQLLSCKRIANKSGGGDERYKVILSDGTHFCSGMCATQLNHLVHAGVLAQDAVIRVTEFIVNVMGSGQRICIVLGAESAGPNPGCRIGSPNDITKGGGAGAG
ncbi:hypothetical protein THAOC_01533, partial [Thalassiosira oceanica]